MIRLVVLLALLLPVVADAEVPFTQKDLKAALAKAKSEKRPLMVDVFATWCGPCKELDAKVFATPQATAELKDFVALKIDAEEGEGPKFIADYHVVGYPTVLFLDSEGREIDRIFGSTPLDDFLRTARDYRAGKGTLEESEKKFRTERGADFELAFELLFRNAVRGREERVKDLQDLLDVAWRGFVGRTSVEQRAAFARLSSLAAQGRYVTGKYLYLRGKKDFARARDVFLALRRDFPKSEFAEAALYDLAWAYDGLKDEAKTRETLDAYLAGSKDGTGAANAYGWFSFKHRFQLDRGIEVTRAALAKDGKDDGLWDTLAELHGAKGEKAKAIEAEGKAISLKPKDAYYAEQKKKFEALK